MPAYYPTGDTVRAQATFTDFAPAGSVGAIIDPTSVTVNTYDASFNRLTGPITPTKDSSGIYHYDWTLPVTEGTYYIEFIGIITGENTISRTKIVTRFFPNT